MERMSDEEFDKLKFTNNLRNDIWYEAKRAREAEKELEKINEQLCEQSNFAMNKASELAIENAELGNALIGIVVALLKEHPSAKG